MSEISNRGKTALIGIAGVGAWATIVLALHRFAPGLTGDVQTVVEGVIALALLGAGWLVHQAWTATKAQIAVAETPTATGDRLSIVIAALANDERAAIRERIQLSLRQELQDKVEVLLMDECIALGTQGSLDARERAAQSAGQAVLNRCKADLLIWGARVPDENVIDLNFLVREVAPVLGTPKSYKLSETMRLPAEFGADLGTSLVSVALTAVAPAYDNGRYVADLLVPVARRLGAIVASMPASLPSESRAQIVHGYGAACLTIGAQQGDSAYLSRAITAFRAALEEYKRDKVPLDWATTQNNLGNALWTLGERESGTARLEEAVAAFRAALEERTRDKVPLAWAMTQNNLGNALSTLGERESGTARLEEAVAAFRAALEEHARDKVPLAWAMTQNNLGNALSTLGERESGVARLEEAVAAYRAALEERTRDKVPLDWATTQNNLGTALKVLGERESGTARLEEAVAAFRAALEEYTRDKVPLDWAMTQNNLGTALWTLGERESGTARLEEAVAAYRATLEEYTRDKVPLQWASTQNNLGAALATLGKRESGTARLEEAATALREALREWRIDNAPHFNGIATRNLARIEALLAERRAQIA